MKLGTNMKTCDSHENCETNIKTVGLSLNCGTIIKLWDYH